MKAPTLAIVGRPNVGKSTLFNCLTRTRDALVVDEPGVTRDRIYGVISLGEIPLQIVDTSGVDGEQEPNLKQAIAMQIESALQEANVYLFVVDGRAGIMPSDRDIAARLRKLKKIVILVVNKTDGLDIQVCLAEFYSLGFDHVVGISSAHQRGLIGLMEVVYETLGLNNTKENPTIDEQHPGLKIAVLGRPNVGKSTLINRLLHEERVVVCDLPGTTRDSIYIPLQRFGKNYTLIDTAGVRRRSRVQDVVEKFSVIKTNQAIDNSDCVILVLNAREEVSDQDITLLRQIFKVGRALVIAVNKWDGLDADEREAFKKNLKMKFFFAPSVYVHTMSALHGTGVGELFDLVQDAYDCANQLVSASKLTKILIKAVFKHSLPLSRGRRVRLKFAQCVGHNPMKIIIHGNQTEVLPDHYKKYLYKTFAKELNMIGAPMHIDYRSSENPFEGKVNVLTPRQIKKKRRLMKFVSN